MNNVCYQDVLWKSGFSRLYSEMPSRKLQAEGHKDACRVHGALTLNKVAGNFHVTAGKVTTITIFGSFPKNAIFLIFGKKCIVGIDSSLAKIVYSGASHNGCARSYDRIHGNIRL